MENIAFFLDYFLLLSLDGSSLSLIVLIYTRESWTFDFKFFLALTVYEPNTQGPQTPVGKTGNVQKYLELLG